MKKVVCFLAAVCLGVFAFGGTSFAQQKNMDIPEMGFSIALPEDFYAAVKGIKLDTSIPQTAQDVINDSRNNYLPGFLWGVSADGVLRLTAASTHTVIEDYTSPNDSQIKNDMEISKTATPTNGKLLRLETYQTGQWVYIKRVISYQGEYWIKYQTVRNGFDYYYNFETKGYKGKELSSKDESAADAVVNSITYSKPQEIVENTPTPVRSDWSPATGQSQSLPSESGASATLAAASIVKIDEIHLSFVLPGNFVGIAKDGDTGKAGKWNDLFALMKSKMGPAGVYYYAIRTDTKNGVPSQMAIYAPGTDPAGLQVFFDAGMRKLQEITGITPKTIQDPGKQDGKFYVNNIAFTKDYRFSGQYSWVLYTPERTDVPFAFAYAPGILYMDYLETTDIEMLINSFHAQLKSGENIPGRASTTEYFTRLYYIIIGLITGGCVLAAVLIMVLRYRSDKKVIAHGSDGHAGEKALLKRLRNLREENILTSEEYKEKRDEIKNRQL